MLFVGVKRIMGVSLLVSDTPTSVILEIKFICKSQYSVVLNREMLLQRLASC